MKVVLRVIKIFNIREAIELKNKIIIFSFKNISIIILGSGNKNISKLYRGSKNILIINISINLIPNRPRLLVRSFKNYFPFKFPL